MHFAYSHSPYTIRDNLKQSYRDYRAMLARPGNSWTGEQRVAIAAESRNANSCDFCAARKQALSPYNFDGEHTH